MLIICRYGPHLQYFPPSDVTRTLSKGRFPKRINKNSHITHHIILHESTVNVDRDTAIGHLTVVFTVYMTVVLTKYLIVALTVYMTY